MKTLKLIVLMLLTANFVTAQTTYGENAGELGDDTNAYFGVNAGADANSNKNTFIGAETGTNTDIGGNNVGIGYGALKTSTGYNNTSIGLEAGQFLNSSDNVFIGKWAGKLAESGNSNVGIGSESLKVNDGGQNNLAIGYRAGQTNTGGGNNIFMGAYAGNGNKIGGGNIYIGASAGNGQDSYGNIAIGSKAGQYAYDETSSSSSIFLGSNAGKNRPTGRQRELYIQSQSDNDNNAIPLIYGNFSTKKIGIGTTTPENALDVNGTIRAKEIKVESGWSDYVFYDDYQVPTLEEEEKHIEENGYLLGFESEEDMQGEILIGDVSRRQQAKIEEMMLHLIEMNKAIKALQQSEKKLREENETLKVKLSEK